ncbi:MAG: putative transporter [Candidatus Hydrogenedentota bacterium]
MSQPRWVSDSVLQREIGVFGATLMGLGSILGTGVFVSLAIAAGVAGPSVILATALAALVATCNALSSAQLAAAHPISGGTYEYGYQFLTPRLGFTAGWMFLCAKSASAATAGLGFAGYVLNAAGMSGEASRIVLAVVAVAVLTAIAAGGVTRSNRANVAIVGLTVVALLAFVATVLPAAMAKGSANLTPFFRSESGEGWTTTKSLLHATALMFVAYTGYGRIATLGEEVKEPRKTIPRAIVTTLVVSASLYILVALAAVGAAGSEVLAQSTAKAAAPLEIIAREFGRIPGGAWIVALGAVTAMLGVLLNLILGLSRVLLAMGRRGDAPGALSRINQTKNTPYVAVWVIGIAVGALCLLGDVKTTWSFSAFTVLVYYAITNFAALRLPPEHRLYPRAWAWGGLASCLFLAFWVEPRIWFIGLMMIGLGLVWFTAARRVSAP